MDIKLNTNLRLEVSKHWGSHRGEPLDSDTYESTHWVDILDENGNQLVEKNGASAGFLLVWRSVEPEKITLDTPSGLIELPLKNHEPCEIIGSMRESLG